MTREQLLHLRSAYLSRISSYLRMGQDVTKSVKALNEVNLQLEANGGLPRKWKKNKQKTDSKFQEKLKVEIAGFKEQRRWNGTHWLNPYDGDDILTERELIAKAKENLESRLKHFGKL